MAWQRTIPFGYQMRQGEIACELREADAIKNIFSRYLQGESLKQIAEAMTHGGIPYHQHTAEWNKHMVKRILENGHYLGDETYPRLIDNDTYLAARMLKEGKTTYTPCPVDADIREKAVCGRCGARMTRRNGARGKTRWVCENASCAIVTAVSDDTLTSAINNILGALARDPQPLETPIPRAPIQERNAFRIMNELTNAFNRGTESPEYLRSLIFAVAAEKYNEFPDTTLQYKLDRLRARLESGEDGETIRQELLKTAVLSIRLTDPDDIALELVNGNLVGKGAVSA